jgi:hypothetical protein
MSYHIGSQNIVAIPIYVRHNISFREAGGGRLDITVGPKQTVGRTVSTAVYVTVLQIFCYNKQNILFVLLFIAFTISQYSYYICINGVLFSESVV